MNAKEVVRSTVAYIEGQLREAAGEGLSLDEIAGRIGYSKFHLNRLFLEEVGATMHQYILQRRLTAAAEQLVETDKPIAEIAYEVGYQSQQSFTGAFGRRYLQSPQAYRLAGRRAPLRRRHSTRATLRMGVAA